MDDVDPARSQDLPGIAAVELHVERAGLEARRVQRAARGELPPVAAQGQLTRDGTERAGEVPGTQVEVLDHGVGLPVPVMRQVEHLAAELALKRRDDPGA